MPAHRGRAEALRPPRRNCFACGRSPGRRPGRRARRRAGRRAARAVGARLEQLGVKASIGGLGRVEVNLDTTVLQAVLQQQLTGAIDTKFALVTEQLAEAQQDLAHKTQLLERTRNELEDVTNRLGACVTWQDLDDVKTMESRLKSQFSKQLDRVSSEAAGAVEKLREQKADKEVVDRLIDRESVERLASMEVALSQQARAQFFGAQFRRAQFCSLTPSPAHRSASRRSRTAPTRSTRSSAPSASTSAGCAASCRRG